VNGDIDPSIDQSVFEFLCENTLPTDYGQGIRFYVTRRLYDFDLNFDGRIRLKQAGLSLFSLKESEFRAT
jgi:hypothetical protein